MQYLIPKNVRAKMILFAGLGLKESLIVIASAILGYVIGNSLSSYIHFALTGYLGALLTGAISFVLSIELPAFNQSLFGRLHTIGTYFKHPKLFFYSFATGRTNQSSSQPTTQSNIQLLDVNRNFAWRRDHQLVAYIRIEPVNVAMMKDSKQREKVIQMKAALSSITDAYQVLCISRSVDMSIFKQDLQNKSESSSNPIQQQLLKMYQSEADQMIASGTANERRFYLAIAMPIANEKNPRITEEELWKKAYAIVNDFNSMELSAHLCTDQEIRELLFTFYRPASTEDVPTTNSNLFALYLGGQP